MSKRQMTRAELVEALSRYRDLVSDWPAFIDALRAPHVPCVRINQSRIGADHAVAAMVAQGLQPEPIAWLPGAYRVNPDVSDIRSVGRNWLYQAGLYQVQEESSMLPVRLLDPRPGEHVLDLCAAPGNKTAQIAAALGGRGTVIANDRSRNRLAALHNTISRLGLVNVTMTAADGCQFPMQPQPFDRALVDAPCTAEGTARKHGRAGEKQPGFARHINGIQRALLRRALLLTRPGGRVVYSTCTFAPEENEMVIDAVLAAHPGLAQIVSVPPPPDLPISPGVTHWNGRALSPQVSRCMRMWPHLTGTGGFFVAVLQRSDVPVSMVVSMAEGDLLHGQSGTPAGWPPAHSPPPEWKDATDHPSVLGCCMRYGLDASLFTHLLVGQRGRYLRAVARDHRLPTAVTVVASGLPTMPTKASQPRFTTAGVLAFGTGAGTQVIDLTEAQSASFLRRETIALQGHTTGRYDRGFVIVRRAGQVALGNGQIVSTGDSVALESRFKKAWLRGP